MPFHIGCNSFAIEAPALSRIWGRRISRDYSIEFREITMNIFMISVLAFVSGVKDRLSSEKGATATEYSLLVAFIAFGIIVGVTAFGTGLNTWFTELGATVTAWKN
jgi:pilus assembly protein Flp/PilA